MDSAMVFKWLLSTLFVGGALWKGLDSLANAYSARADAANANKRLQLEQEQYNYTNAMALIDRQAARIDALHEDITALENSWGSSQMAYLDRIRTLESEIITVKREYKDLLERYTNLECDYKIAIDRIEELEKRGTGPLPENVAH